MDLLAILDESRRNPFQPITKQMLDELMEKSLDDPMKHIKYAMLLCNENPSSQGFKKEIAHLSIDTSNLVMLPPINIHQLSAKQLRNGAMYTSLHRQRVPNISALFILINLESERVELNQYISKLKLQRKLKDLIFIVRYRWDDYVFHYDVTKSGEDFDRLTAEFDTMLRLAYRKYVDVFIERQCSYEARLKNAIIPLNKLTVQLLPKIFVVPKIMWTSAEFMSETNRFLCPVPIARAASLFSLIAFPSWLLNNPPFENLRFLRLETGFDLDTLPVMSSVISLEWKWERYENGSLKTLNRVFPNLKTLSIYATWNVKLDLSLANFPALEYLKITGPCCKGEIICDPAHFRAYPAMSFYNCPNIVVLNTDKLFIGTLYQGNDRRINTLGCPSLKSRAFRLHVASKLISNDTREKNMAALVDEYHRVWEGVVLPRNMSIKGNIAARNIDQQNRQEKRE